MSAIDVKKVETILGLINTHEVEQLLNHYEEECTFQNPFMDQPKKGKQAVKEAVGSLLSSFPDLRFAAKAVAVTGNTAAIHWSASGTGQGELSLPNGTKVPVSNKKLSYDGATFLTFSDRGLILQHRVIFDSASVGRQLGIPPAWLS